MLSNLARCLVLMVLPLSVSWADDDTTLFNQIHLQAQVERDVENDQLEVNLAVEKQGNSPEEIASEVNETMKWALDQANSIDDIEVKTGSYQTYPIYQNRLIVGWRASQELVLKSVEITSLTELVGDLQERLQVRQMNFSPTRTTREKIENDLISEAMESFKQRAEIVGKHMDNDNYRIVNLHINTGQSGPVMFQEAMMSRAAINSAVDIVPAVEAGTSKVIVTVSGSIQFF
jgi:predicted secreted protein